MEMLQACVILAKFLFTYNISILKGSQQPQHPIAQTLPTGDCINDCDFPDYNVVFLAKFI